MASLLYVFSNVLCALSDASKDYNFGKNSCHNDPIKTAFPPVCLLKGFVRSLFYEKALSHCVYLDDL